MSLLLPTPPTLELPDPVLLAAGLPELSPWVLVPWLTRLVSKEPPRKRLVSALEPLTLEPEEPCAPWRPGELCELCERWVSWLPLCGVELELPLEPGALEPEFNPLCERDVPFVEVPEVLEGLLPELLLSRLPEAELVLALELEIELPCVLSEPEVLELVLDRSMSVEVETLPEVEVSSVPLAEVEPAGAPTPEVLMDVLL